MMLMAGWDRTYPEPGSGRAVDAWQMLGSTQAWATRTVDRVIASLAAPAQATLDDCAECEDSGLYGVEATPDELTALIRVREGTPEVLAADGSWSRYTGGPAEMRFLTRDLAVDLAEAVLAGASRLVLRPVMPRAFLPPSSCQPVLAAVDLTKEPTDAPAAAAPSGGDAAIGDGWNYYVIVDELDTGAVLDVFRLKPGPELERYDGTGWVADPEMLADLQGVTPPPVVEITDPQQFADVYRQVQTSYQEEPPEPGDKAETAGVTAAVEDNLPDKQKCKYCKNPATKRILHSEGMAYIAVCDDHLAKGKDDATHSTPSGDPDPSNINWVHDMAGKVVAAALVADAPLTVSPNMNAEKLRRYWSVGGKGGAKIRWGTPSDFTRCVRYLRKYLGARAKGYCANMHKRNTGMWPGDKRNRVGSGPPVPELQLLSSIRTGTWISEDGKATDMLADGIYTERVQDVLVASLIAGGFPVEPPPDWFENPGLTAATPITVDDNGRVYGHLADWETAHIGLPGETHAPKSRSDYAFFKTGVLRTAGGADVNVGQLTLVGGHAPLSADAASAVKHYDDTASAVADVAIGEDQHGIWVAGAMRPEVTPAQLRAFRASALSGDWRPIKGSLELVAACAVNVPGFPIARARVAGGQVLAMVAAGARRLYVKQISLLSDAALAERVSALEALLADIGVTSAEGTTVSTTPSVPATQLTPTGNSGTDVSKLTPLDPGETPPEQDGQGKREEVRAKVRQIRRDRLRRRVHVTTPKEQPVAAGGGTPDFRDGLSHDVRQAIRDRVHGVTSAGLVAGERAKIGGYPISDVESLKKAIKAYGRARPQDQAATRAHIISEAKKLKRTDLIPNDWLTGSAALAASARVDAVRALTAARIGKYLEWQHPRGIGGKWIEKLGAVDVLDQHGGGKGKRGTIKDLTEKGPVVQYPDGKSETIPLKDAATRIRVAPKARGELPGEAPESPKALPNPDQVTPGEKMTGPAAEANHAAYEAGRATPRELEAKAAVPEPTDKQGRPLPRVERDADGKIIVSDEAKRLGSEVYQRGVEAEPDISAELAGLVGDSDPANYREPGAGEGKLYGFQYRLKAEAGVQEKVERNVEEDKLQREDAAANIKDAVRYTVHFPEDEFGRRSQEVIDQLTRDNAKVVVKNTWPPEAGRAYKGVNVNVWRDDGTVYEVQFHTPESQRVKDQMHGLYEDQRKTVHRSPEWQRIEDQMNGLGAGLVRNNAPQGVNDIHGYPPGEKPPPAGAPPETLFP